VELDSTGSPVELELLEETAVEELLELEGACAVELELLETSAVDELLELELAVELELLELSAVDELLELSAVDELLELELAVELELLDEETMVSRVVTRALGLLAIEEPRELMATTVN